MRTGVKRLGIAGAVLLGVVLVSVTANAAILLGPLSAVTGINGLVVDSKVYDVTFSLSGSFDDRGQNPPTFLGDEAGAFAATAAIRDVFEGSVTGVTNLSGANLVYVPYAFPSGTTVTSAITQQYPSGSSSWFSGGGIILQRSDNSDYISWASFTETGVVPEPATLALFGLGLAGAGIARRRKRKA